MQSTSLAKTITNTEETLYDLLQKNYNSTITMN